MRQTNEVLDSKSDQQLRLITWNVERASVSRFKNQLTALQERIPDIIALQEVGINVSRRPRRLLREHGFEYTAHSHEYRLTNAGNSSGVAFASRWPFRILSPDTFTIPAQHHTLSAEFFTPFGRVEGHTVHVLPGSMDRQRKTEMFEGIYDRLAQKDRLDYRFLCGDFNSPKEESEDGNVTVWGSDERNIEAERSVIVELAEYDLADAYREVNGYGNDEYSWVAKNRGNEWPRRFDHVFASEHLNATEASYLHDYDDLSDHTPLEVVFTPKGGLHEETEALDRSPYTVSQDRTETDFSSTVVSSELTYDEDVRAVAPDANYRRGRFKAGWNKSVDGAEMDAALDQLTWENLGWRLGQLFGDTSEELQEELYEWCVKQQVE
ncbi:endonuclease/exonuclease/phosphatase family protein [Halalkalicoccus sp. GCM10025322]|uniref:endonuclease/exonuclease/phosphatase family protein n=1 Tax=Halalkalicoccus TaxID=332246 RepID=UPI002F9688AA